MTIKKSIYLLMLIVSVYACKKKAAPIGKTEKQLESKPAANSSTLTIEQQIAEEVEKIENIDKEIEDEIKKIENIDKYIDKKISFLILVDDNQKKMICRLIFSHNKSLIEINFKEYEVIDLDSVVSLKKELTDAAMQYFS